MNNANQNRNHAVNGDMPPEDDDVGSDHDSMDSLSSLSSNEIENHFVERHGRRFHSHGNGVPGPYPFPVDELEKQRMNDVHNLLKAILRGRNYRGPAQDVLVTPAGGRRARILDICTGSGKWVDEMAVEFPQAKVYGLDIVPMATRFPADNVQFEIHDINERTRWVDGRFDLVHMRNVSLAVINYRTIICEIARILRPQGLFLSGEWSCTVSTTDGSGAPRLATGVSRFISTVMQIARPRGIHPAPELIPQMLAHSGCFGEIVPEQHIVALDDSPLGARAKRMLLDFGDSARGLFIDYGHLLPRQIEGILQGLRSDLETVTGMRLVYHTVHARRNAVVNA
ncbi:hypothetical protein M0805_003925 [Coniferiporia weirii]|nr:hypothetical protein M0805_003925 [Coniferiporia weirii]